MTQKSVVLVCACGAKYPGALFPAGKTFPCNQCGRAITVPGGAPAEPADATDAEPASDSSAGTLPAVEPEQRESDRRGEDRRAGERRKLNLPAGKLPAGERRKGPPDRRQIQRRVAERRKELKASDEPGFEPRVYQHKPRSFLWPAIFMVLGAGLCAVGGGVLLGPVLGPLLNKSGDGQPIVQTQTVELADWVDLAERLAKSGYPEAALRVLEMETARKGKLTDHGEEVRRYARSRLGVEVHELDGLAEAMEDLARMQAARPEDRKALMADFQVRYKGGRVQKAMRAIMGEAAGASAPEQAPKTE